MKKLIETLAVFIVGGVMAAVLNVSAQDAKTPSADNSIPAVQLAAPPTDPYSRHVDCPVCGGGFYVVGKEPFKQIACECGSKLNVAEGDGGSLTAQVAVEKVVNIVAEEPAKTPELAGPPPEINWRTNVEAAKREAIAGGKSLLVVQTKTVGCIPCEELKKYVFTDPRVVKYVNENCVPCLVVDKQIFSGQHIPFPAMWLRSPSGGGSLWRGARFQGDKSFPIPKEPEAFIAAIKKAAGG